MADQTEATRQSDWILPPNVDQAGQTNCVVLPTSSAVTIVDMASIPCPRNYYDPIRGSSDRNPLGHYVSIAAQTSDVYFIFGPNWASFVSGALSGITVTSVGSGWKSAPTVVLGGSGGGGAATATIDTHSGTIKSIAITAAGSGYSATGTTVSFTGGSGFGGTASVQVGTTPTPTTVSTIGGSATMGVGGSGYVVTAPGTMWPVPAGTTYQGKLPLGQEQPWGENSGWRFLAICTTGGSGFARISQSSV